MRGSIWNTEACKFKVECSWIGGRCHYAVSNVHQPKLKIFHERVAGHCQRKLA